MLGNKCRFSLTDSRSAIADSFSEIAGITLTVNGEALELDERGRGTFTPDQPGRYAIQVTAIDEQGFITTQNSILKVKDPADTLAPSVVLSESLNGAVLGEETALIGTIFDTNLDEWVLELGNAQGTEFKVIAQGHDGITNDVIANLNPEALTNGFYQLRLTATDLGNRTTTEQVSFEVNTATKSAAYRRSETDLSVEIAGTTLDLVRVYDSLAADESGRFGSGWRFANTEFQVESNVPDSGREAQGLLNPFEAGTRVYVTLPTGERVGFTFEPQVQQMPGLQYFTPNWVADAGVEYRLESVPALLTRGEDRFYDLKTARPYNPVSGQWQGPEYRLIASDGTVYELSSQRGVEAQVLADGTRLSFSDSGIIASNGEAIRFVSDAAGRLTRVVGSEGETVVYAYDELGQLISARNVASGDGSRYGYDADGLLSVSTSLTASGERIGYGTGVPVVTSIEADLGSAYGFAGEKRSGALAADESAVYTFTVRESELASVAEGIVLVGVEVTATSGDLAFSLPIIEGLKPVISRVDGSTAYAVFAVERSGLHVLEVAGDAGTSGEYDLQLSILGDVNLDGFVDGVDSQLIAQSIADRVDEARFDLNQDAIVDAVDVQILNGNFGFATNQAPVITPEETLTHVDLETFVLLSEQVLDLEGDEVFYSVNNPVNGSVEVSRTGEGIIFTPDAGFSGTASFELLANDGFNSSEATVIHLNVSDAALISLDFVERQFLLDIGENIELQVIGDFEDQNDVLLPDSYLNFKSENILVGVIENNGIVQANSNGITILSASHDQIQTVTTLRVGDIPTPTTQVELNSVLAEENGLGIYPEAIILEPGGTRQIKVDIANFLGSPDLQSASTGTRYFAGNSDIVNVSQDGLVTANQEGNSYITVIQGGVEEVVPVLIEQAQLNSSTIGSDGGVVQSDNGTTVLIPEGALQNNIEVSIEQINQNELPVNIPNDFTFAGAFRLDVGEESLNSPVQISVPSNSDLEIGTEVFFMRQEMLPDSEGILRPVWLIEESGIIGEDGVIRTQSPPWDGVKNSGLYTIGVPKFEYKVFEMPLPAEARFAVGLAFMGASLLALSTTPIALFGINAGALLLASSLLDDFSTYLEIQLDVLTIPQTTGLAKISKTKASLNLSQLNTQSPVAIIDTAGFGDLDYSPIVEAGRVGFDEDGVYIRVPGTNFAEGENNPNEAISVELDYGNQTYVQDDVEFESNENGGQSIVIRVPNSVPTSSQLNITVVRTVGLNTDVPEQYLSQTVPVVLDYFDRVISANPISGTVKVFNSNRSREVVERDGSSNLLLASIPLGSKSVPRYVTALEDRIYVPLEGEGKIALIDAIGLRELDTNPSTSAIDRIDLKQPGATPSFIVLNKDQTEAYITDRNNGSIYVLNIDPFSSEYHQTTQISLEGVRNVHRLSLNSSGSHLFATVTTTEGKGRIIVIDANTNAVLNLKINTSKGVEGISSTDQSDTMLFTNRLVEYEGFGVLNLKYNSNGVPVGYDIEYVNMLLGSTNDVFDANEAVDVLWVRDQLNQTGYAFVAARNGRLFGSGIPSIDAAGSGSNVGIVQFKEGSKPKLVAATTPIPMGLVSSISLSANEQYLYVPQPLARATFIYDVHEILNTLDDVQNNSNLLNELSLKPIDEINSRIRVAANTSPQADGTDPNLVKDRPIGAGDSYGVTSHRRAGEIVTFEPEIEVDGNQRKIRFNWELYEPKDILGNFLDEFGKLFNSATEFVSDLAGGTAVAFPTSTQLLRDPSIRPLVRPKTKPKGPSTSNNGISRNPLQKPPKLKNGAWYDIFFNSGQDPLAEPSPEPDPVRLRKRTDIEEVKLYVSVFPKGEGLVPKDWKPEFYLPNQDYNPNRILEANWTPTPGKKDGTGKWVWLDSKGNPQSIPGFSYEFELPGEKTLTAGQSYYYYVQLKKKGKDVTSAPSRPTIFRVKPAELESTPASAFPSITFLPINLEEELDLDQGFSILPTERISGVLRNYARSRSSFLWYSSSDQSWSIAEYKRAGFGTGDYQLSPRKVSVDDLKTLPRDKPLVILANIDDRVNNVNGFIEAEADNIFAALVDLDLSLGGRVAATYSPEGELSRTHGAVFNSPLHFIGFGRGAVVNTEIVQRIGTYYPHAGGSVDQSGNPRLDVNGNPVRDLQFTTIDPYSYGFNVKGTGSKGDLFDPEIKIWDNVTFADNYYQTFARKQNTTRGFNLPGADWNINLSTLRGFDAKNAHSKALAWYSGTANVNIKDSYDLRIETRSDAPRRSIPDYTLFKRFGDIEKRRGGPSQYHQEASKSAWYTPDHLLTEISVDANNKRDANTKLVWEGIGTGWFYSVTGGGTALRPYNVFGQKQSRKSLNQAYFYSQRTPVSFDNSSKITSNGDYAVPTLFNGNFDALSKKDSLAFIPFSSQDVPGWGELGQDALVRRSSLGLQDLSSSLSNNFAIKLSRGTSVRHNPFMVPEWGALRFDLHTGLVDENGSGELKVFLDSPGALGMTTLLQRRPEQM